jgi:hypothetical protein
MEPVLWACERRVQQKTSAAPLPASCAPHVQHRAPHSSPSSVRGSPSSYCIDPTPQPHDKLSPEMYRRVVWHLFSVSEEPGDSVFRPLPSEGTCYFRLHGFCSVDESMLRLRLPESGDVRFVRDIGTRLSLRGFAQLRSGSAFGRDASYLDRYFVVFFMPFFKLQYYTSNSATAVFIFSI